MSWSYRVVKTSAGYGVFEVYFDDEGRPISRTENPILDFVLEDPEGFREELTTIAAACDQPVILDSEISRTANFEQHVAETLRRNWNPYQPDEELLFSNYVTNVVKLLREGVEANTLAEYLSRVEANRLGFNDTEPEELIPVSRKLKALLRGAT